MARTVIVVSYPSVEAKAAGRGVRTKSNREVRVWTAANLQEAIRGKDPGCVLFLKGDGCHELPDVMAAIKYLGGEKITKVVTCPGCGWIYSYEVGKEHLLPENCPIMVTKRVCSYCGAKANEYDEKCSICSGRIRVTREPCGARIR